VRLSGLTTVASAISDGKPRCGGAIESDADESGPILKELATPRSQPTGMAAAGTESLNQGRI